MLLALLLSAAPIELVALDAALLSSNGSVVGTLEDLALTPMTWATPTLLRARHSGSRVEFEGFVDVSREGTLVEARIAKDLAVTTEPGWRIVLKAGAAVPLLGRLSDGLRLGFRPNDAMVVKVVTVPETPAPLPTMEKPVDDGCTAMALYRSADLGAPRWAPSSAQWDLVRSAKVGAWFPAYAEGGLARVYGFVHERDVHCGLGMGGGFGISGMGSSCGDGSLSARAVTLPASTRLFARADLTEQVATLKQPTPALVLEDGSLRTELIRSGPGEVRFVRVFASMKGLEPGPLTSHGVGRQRRHEPDWPRLERKPQR